jgi:hypothetical protein
MRGKFEKRAGCGHSCQAEQVDKALNIDFAKSAPEDAS